MAKFNDIADEIDCHTDELGGKLCDEIGDELGGSDDALDDEELFGDFEDLEALAKAVDDQILSQTVLYPINHWAAKKLHPDLRGSPFAEVSKLLSEKFEQRLSSCPPEDQAYWLRIYANPARRSLMPNTPTS